jgi:predicted ATPase
MITRIEIDGFKSFHKFAVDFRPFQVFIGPNGVGKTNLFDAIVLLANLAGDHTLEDAFRHSRGELSELFTLYPDGTRAKTIALAAEMLIEETATDAAGKSYTASSTRLRYELDLSSRIEGGRDHVYVVREALLPLKESDDAWVKDNIPSKIRKSWIIREKRPPYIATTENGNGTATIYRNEDGPGSGKESTVVGNIDRTILSTADSTRYPTIHRVRQEMLNWRFLQLNPFALRMPTTIQGPTTLLPDGSNLTAVLSRIAKDGLSGVLKDMTAFIPSIQNVAINPVPDHDEHVIEVETQDKSRFSSRVLSDGTLRLLALVTLKNDAQHRGLLCFEEPENGVQPLRLKNIVDVLFALTSDLSKESSKVPLRQVLVNTHSPGLMPNVPSDSLYYVHMRTEDKGRATRVIPVRAELIQDENERYYTWEQVNQYLAAMNQQRDEIGL